MLQLRYDPRDDAFHERIGSQILYWLGDLDAIPLDEAPCDVEGFLFAGARPGHSGWAIPCGGRRPVRRTR